MPDIILKIILPCAGIVVILFCIGAYFFKYGINLKDNIQEFKMFGADLRISIVTVFVLIGLILVCYMVWGDEDKEVPIKCTAITQNNQQRLQVTISDLVPGTFITAMVVQELSTGKKWIVNSFFPLSPSLKLLAVK